MVIDVVLAAASLPALAWTMYLAALAVLSREGRAPADAAPQTKFDVIVPAHNEEQGIAATVESLLATDFPAGMRRVIVVADNCRDQTEARATEAGAIVLARSDPSKRGKGHALAHAFARSLADGVAGAVVVVD
ncbi:MAG: glycosyltransferase, partial [Polyangiaceae bacterium]